MKNEKPRVRMGSLAYKIGMRHSSFKNFCNLFDIRCKEEVNKDSYMSAELADHFVRYEFLARMYNADYYSDKTPKSIGNLLQRNEDDVLQAIKAIDPSYFVEGHFKRKSEYSLRYLSSFEVDKHLDGNYDFLAFVEK